MAGRSPSTVATRRAAGPAISAVRGRSIGLVPVELEECPRAGWRVVCGEACREGFLMEMTRYFLVALWLLALAVLQGAEVRSVNRALFVSDSFILFSLQFEPSSPQPILGRVVHIN